MAKEPEDCRSHEGPAFRLQFQWMFDERVWRLGFRVLGFGCSDSKIRGSGVLDSA